MALSATLYLPPGYTARARACRSSSGPTRRSSRPRPRPARSRDRPTGSRRHRPRRICSSSRRATRVLDDPTMPIVGPGETANDTFVEQLVASAKAAIDKLVEMGVADRDRIGVGGHSYGAFMTANLLAHSRPLPRRHRPQRRLQPHADAVRLPDRAADLLGSAGDLREDVAVLTRRQDQGADPAHPRRGRQQLGHVPDPVRAAVRRPQGHTARRPATSRCPTKRTAMRRANRCCTP